jgi:Sec-independent protein translocase protein TatA
MQQELLLVVVVVVVAGGRGHLPLAAGSMTRGLMKQQREPLAGMQASV